MEPDLEETKKRRSLQDLLGFAILNVDKPSGPTSFRTTEIVGRTLGEGRRGLRRHVDVLQVRFNKRLIQCRHSRS